MWFADVILDLPWFVARQGKLGDYAACTSQDAKDPDPQIEIVLYGDEEAIRHLRVMIHTDDHAVADACSDRNIQGWISALEVSSALATPTFTTAAQLQKNSAAFMVVLAQGQIDADACKLNLEYTPPAKANLVAAAKIMTGWKPGFEIHLHYFSRFLNTNLLPEVRWLNGYRLLEWHFLRGKSGLAGDKRYREFVDEHGSGFDAYLRRGQTRWRLVEEARALVAHAILAVSADANSEKGTTDLVLKTFSAMETLVAHVMNEGSGAGIEIRQNVAT
jgi:hypothetical protein